MIPRLLIALLLIAVPATAQTPLPKVATKDGAQFKAIIERQAALAAEYQQLEQGKLIVKLRACLDNKLDTAKCDSMDIVPEADGFALRERPAQPAEAKKP
jgi:hypothetical protein